MSESDKVFAGSIPGSYDSYMVPLIFENFAEDIAQRAAALSPSSVLETAAGTGVVTRALTPRTPDAVLARPISLANYPVATGRPLPGHQRRH